MKKPNNKIGRGEIKGWTLFSEELGWLGTGQGYYTYWYKKEDARKELKRINESWKLIVLDWKIVKIKITLEQPKT